jgi:hypothetical protein
MVGWGQDETAPTRRKYHAERRASQPSIALTARLADR